MGRAPITIPSGVNVSNSGLTYTVKVRQLLLVPDAQQCCAAAALGCLKQQADGRCTLFRCQYLADVWGERERPSLSAKQHKVGTADKLCAQGPKGELERTFSPLVRIETLVRKHRHHHTCIATA